MLQSESTFGWLYLPIHVFLLPQLLRWLLAALHLTVGGSGFNALYYALSLAIVLVAFSRYFTASGKAFSLHLGRGLGAIALGFALQYTLTALLLALLTRLFGNVPIPNNDQVAAYAAEDALPMLFCSLIAAPIVEETLLRGAVFSSLHRKYKFAAYLVSSVLFAAMHVWQYADLGIATQLVAGVCYLPAAVALAWTQQQSDSVFAPIFLHLLINLLAVLKLPL
ncbi:MAG: CPBP family intramembrane metalloprotease [Oscillospiraceae bacterium]|nr:CPBP family intramembrane metalloprotease [Oscillospiraceae bacterium]